MNQPHVNTLPNPVLSLKHNTEVRVPLPVRNTIQGGAHGVIKAKLHQRTLKYNMSDLDIQERHLIPMNYDMATNQEIANTIQDVAMNLIFGREGMRVMGTCNEGGIGAFFRKWGEKGAWKILAEAVNESGYQLGKDILFGVDGAADRFYRGNGVYELDGKNYDSKQLMAYYEEMTSEYPIIYAEDLFASGQEAWKHWSDFTERFGHRIFVSLDDVATTNARLLRPLIEAKAGNMLLLKMNQIGSMLEGWRAAETAHKAGLMTISSHRSTSSIDYMEVEVALALSMTRPNMGRCIFAKCGGAKLIERAMRYTVSQQWVEDWEADAALSEKIPEDTRIILWKGYAAPLNTGDLTLGIRLKLSNGMELNAVVPAGTSTGETEACLVPVSDAVRNANQLIAELDLVGKHVRDLPSQLDFTHHLLALELKESARLGHVQKNDSFDKLQDAAEKKRSLGANTILGMSIIYNRLVAAIKGQPSWLAYREAGMEMNENQMTFDDRAFYSPAIEKMQAITQQGSQTHVMFGASAREFS